MKGFNSLVGELVEKNKPVKGQSSCGKEFFAKKFTAHAADLHKGKVLKLAVAIQSNGSDVDSVGAETKYFVIKNSFCDENGELISNSQIQEMQEMTSLGSRKFIDEVYDHCQKVNEIGKHTPKKKDKDGNVIKDEETGLPKN